MKRVIIPLTVALMAATSAIAQTAPDGTTPAPAEKIEGAPPSTTATPAPAATTSPGPAAEVTASTAGAVTLTDEQAKAWVDKPVYSSDDKNLGEVAAVARSSTGEVSEIHADIGGFLGLGETRIRVMPNEFKLAEDKVVLNVTADQAKQLPKIAK
ncbi:MAG TPA: PRC-barrel domain-containing protein [Hyphomicrobium sp.]|nr:PRC-barrel domain-containing protein [Hyphomicrobium sp.]